LSESDKLTPSVVHERSHVQYEVAGSGEPLVLVHGLSGSSRWWKHNIGPLAERFQVFTIDLIGFGSSRRAGRFVLDQAAAQMCAWMASLGLEKAHLVGHSMGGLICADMAAMAPERVDRLVLVDATIMPFQWGYIGHGSRMARVLPRVPVGFLTVLATDTLRAGPLAVWQAARQLLRADIRPRLDRIRAPTLAIWGGRDHIVPKELGEQLVAALPNARLAVIDDASHVPMWERPADFNKLVLDFLGDSGKRESKIA
jgi:pimeloyl-ACP methyl ester carboxylesterase